MKQYDKRMLSEMTEDEKYSMLCKAVASAKKRFVSGTFDREKESADTNVQFIDKVYREEKIDIISEAYIQLQRRAESEAETKEAYLLMYGSAMTAFQKVLSQRIGKTTWKRMTDGKYKRDEVREVVNVQKLDRPYQEEKYGYAETMIDIIEACKTDRQKHVVYMKSLGYKTSEIAQTFHITQRLVQMDVKTVHKAFRKMK
jgi:hypothetical protein